MRSNTVKMACERPDVCGRSLSHWDCTEIARELVRSGVVESISVETVRQILFRDRLKPWRHQMWLSSKVKRDAAFANTVLVLADLYTRELSADEMVVCVDEKTNLQPRTRLSPTLPTRPDEPSRVENEYERKGALNLFAGFDTRTGCVYATTASRKRQEEFIVFLDHLDQSIPKEKTQVYIILDNLAMHKGKKVRAWMENHTRFKMHHPPVHCSWMNQVEQWFSILARKRLVIADFASKDHLAERLMAFVHEWNEQAHPFRWSHKSFEKILSKCTDVIDPSVSAQNATECCSLAEVSLAA